MQLREQCLLLEQGKKPKLKYEAQTDEKLNALKGKLESIMKIRRTKMSKYKGDLKILSKVNSFMYDIFLSKYINNYLAN